jgi:hypothetical protein
MGSDTTYIESMARRQPGEWDGSYDPDGPDPVDAMPRRARELPSQNGTAMRAVFAYLLDEDSPAATPAPPAKGKKKS